MNDLISLEKIAQGQKLKTLVLDSSLARPASLRSAKRARSRWATWVICALPVKVTSFRVRNDSGRLASPTPLQIVRRDPSGLAQQASAADTSLGGLWKQQTRLTPAVLPLPSQSHVLLSLRFYSSS